MRKIGIVIPVYQEIKDNNELMALHQATKVLSKYPIIFVTPNLSITLPDGYEVRRFDPIYFKSTESYSRLLMTTEFYMEFSDFEYILIYQLDAFVFSDRLMEFCDLNYDYIGAPWDYSAPLTRKMGVRVGNGGLSLRKVSSAIHVTEQRESILQSCPMRERAEEYEDMFFAWCGVNADIDFKIPDVRTAMSFSIEHIKTADKFVNGQLPFGCHRWYDYGYDVWKPYIESYGYKLEEKQNRITEDDYRCYSLLLLIHENLLDYSEKIRLKSYQMNLPKDKHIAIWGYGKDGKCIEKILNLWNINPIIFDKSIRRPELSEIKDTFIVISSSKYEDKISEELSNMGLIRNIDFITTHDFVRPITEMLWNSEM